MGIGAIGVHTSGTSSPGSSARHPTVRANSRRRGATDTCLDEVTPLGPTPEGRTIEAGIHPLHLGPCRPHRRARAAVSRRRRNLSTHNGAPNGGCPVHTTQLPGSQTDHHRPTRIANSGRTYGVWERRHQVGVACNHISAGRERVGGASVCYASQPPCKLRNALSVCQGSPHAPPCKGTGLKLIEKTLPGKRGRCRA